MIELKVKLICSQCKKEISSLSIFRKELKTIKREKREWINKRILLKCNKCKVFLGIITEIIQRDDIDFISNRKCILKEN